MRKIPLNSNTLKSEIITLSLELQEVKVLNNLLVELLDEAPEMFTYSHVQSFPVNSWPPFLYHKIQAKLQDVIEQSSEFLN